LDDNSPLHYITGLHRTIAANPVRVYMFVGRDDGSSAQIVPMARALRRAGASAAYAIYPGGHDWQVWYPRLNQMLMLASHDFATPLPGAHERARRRAAAAARSPRHRRRARAQPVLAPPVVGAQAPARHPHNHHQTLVAALLLALLSS